MAGGKQCVEGREFGEKKIVGRGVVRRRSGKRIECEEGRDRGEWRECGAGRESE